MPARRRPFELFCEVPDHGKVGFTLSKRGSYYFVRFVGPNGKYERKTTRMTAKNEAKIEAERMILREFRPDQFENLVPLTWDEFLQKLQQAMTINGNRPTTFLLYTYAIRAVMKALPETTGPHDIGPKEAQRFKEAFLTHGFKKSKAEDGTVYKRNPSSFNGYLTALRAIWSKWLKELKMTGRNPWNEIAFAKVNKKSPEAPDEDVLAEFFKFVRDTYPGWDLPILFLQTKCLLGCRLMDLCSARSNQLKNGSLSLEPEHMKTRDFRRVPLPENLYRALQALKGKEYLWERYPEQCYAFLKARGHGGPSLRMKMEFSPVLFSRFIFKLFERFHKATGKKLTSHMLKKRAITLLFMEGVPAEVTAKMLNTDPQTIERYYLDLQKLDTSKNFAAFADKLIPPY